MTTSTLRARLAVAMAITAATSTRDIAERRDTAACIEPDVSITTRGPSSAGVLATVGSRVQPRARFQLSDGACLYAAHTWYGNRRALVTSAGSVILAITCSTAASETPAWSKLRRLRTSAI